MPDTRPPQPDRVDCDRGFINDAVAPLVGRSTPRTHIPTLGSTAERAVGGNARPSITWRLTILVIVTIVPVLAFSAFMMVNYAQAQRAIYMQQFLATTRATSLAVDAEMTRLKAILETLRASPEVKNDDWGAFYDFAKTIVAGELDLRVNVFDPSGQMIMTTLAPFGTNLPRTGSPEAIQNALDTKQAFVSDLFISSVTKGYIISVFVPVIENGSVTHILSISAAPTRISTVLRSVILTEGGVGAVIDRKGTVIARTSNEANSIGRKATPDFLAAISGASEGVYEAHSLEGTDFRGAFTKSSLLGWTISLGFDRGEFEAPLWRSLWVFGGGGAALVVCALLLALYCARGIAQPLVALSGIAAALGRGEHIPALRLNLKEAQDSADQLSRSAANLRRRERALELANKELEDLSYSTSHVLRSPLRAIDGFSQILLENHSDGLDGEGKRLIRVLRSSARDLNAQIDGISEFLRLGRDKMSQGNIDMTEAVQMVVEELEPRTRDRKLKIEVYPLPNAFGDAAMIRRVWMSLLDNAAKFTASKGEAKIEVGALSDDKTETVYFVRDNGVGFDMQFAGRLFGVFNRLHGDDFPGDGTGLAIARRIVSRHGGRVWAEGKPDEGATFYFALPASETGHG